MKTVFTFLFATILSLPLQAQSQSNDAHKVARLENQVAVLQERLEKLSRDHDQIKQMLSKLTDEPFGAEQNCNNRLLALQEKRDTLLTLGFKENHPDLANINNTIKSTKAECGS